MEPGTPFLLLPPECWPANPIEHPEIDKSELKKFSFCGAVAVDKLFVSEHKTWTELVKAIAQKLHGAAGKSEEPTANTKLQRSAYSRCKVRVFLRNYNG